jgi:hypothetical protein
MEEYCPLGKSCVDIVEGMEMEICKWYLSFTATRSDGTTFQEKKCAVAWMPIFQMETIAKLVKNESK